MSLQPVDLPSLRDEAIGQMHAHGVARYSAATDALSISGPDIPTGEARARKLTLMQLSALSTAELFFVTTDMAKLAYEAAKTLDTIDLYEQDMPSPEGFMYFDHPIPLHDNGPDGAKVDESSMPLMHACAASWHLVPMSNETGVLVTWFVSAQEIRSLATTQGWAADLAESDLGRVNQDLYMLWRLGARQTLHYGGKPVRLRDANAGLSIATLFSVWHIMRQTLVTVQVAKYNRASLRRLKREYLKPSPVRVVELRRRESSSADGDGSREYHYQWIVRGHWRQQPCGPGSELRRPTWIVPHIKGPEGAPLLGGEKVYALKR